MNVIIGHTNVDMDCIGSMVLARYLYPDYNLLQSRLIHPAAKNLYNLYQNHLNLLSLKDIKGVEVKNVLILDTRTFTRVKEYFDFFGKPKGKIVIYDHHHEKTGDIPDAELIERQVGANTTILGLKIIEQGISISHTDATIALTGIYADTGNFTHENVTDEDFKVAAYLMKQGASINLVKNFMKTLKEDHQITLFHELLNRLYYGDFNGHFIGMSYLEMEEQKGGLAAVVEKVFEVENTDALFSVFFFKKENSVLIVARSHKDRINLNEVLDIFNGGGHPKAASAHLKNRTGKGVFKELEKHLRHSLLPADTVLNIMSRQVNVIREKWSLMDASKFLENINHSGAPVLNDSDELVGFMTLKDIMKGRKGNQMHAPVKAYMSKKLITGSLNNTVREVEKLLYKNHIGHLPITEGNTLKGIITRTDYLKHMTKKISLN